MASFAQNINKIKGDAVYGGEMREAIAEAIQQTMDLDVEGNDGIVFFTVTQIPETDDDFFLSIENGE